MAPTPCLQTLGLWHQYFVDKHCIVLCYANRLTNITCSTSHSCWREIRTGAEHSFLSVCIDVTKEWVGDMSNLGVTESFKVKCDVQLYVAEAAEMIVRVDDILKSAPR